MPRQTADWLSANGVPRQQAGLAVQTLVAVVVRYASLDDASLLAVAMEKTESTAIAAVEAHLSELVAVLIGAEHRPPWQPASAVIRFARQSTSLPT